MNRETMNVIQFGFVALLVSDTTAALHFSEDVRAFDQSGTTLKPVSTPDQNLLRYVDLTPTLSPTPTPEPTSVSTRKLLASTTEAIPSAQLTKGDLIQMLKVLHSKIEFTVEDDLKAVEQASPEVACTIYYEAGRKTKYFEAYDPYVLDGPDIESSFNYGIGQLAPGGKLPEFYRLGYNNPFDPYQVVDYMNDAFARQQQWHWGPVELKLC